MSESCPSWQLIELDAVGQFEPTLTSGCICIGGGATARDALVV